MQSDATADVHDGKGRLGGECDSDLSDVSRERERELGLVRRRGCEVVLFKSDEWESAQT